MPDSVEQYKAETARLRVLLDFLQTGIFCADNDNPDPDVISAYNLAQVACFQQIRKAALDHLCTTSPVSLANESPPDSSGEA